MARPRRSASARATGTRPRTRPTCAPRRPAGRGRRRTTRISRELRARGLARRVDEVAGRRRPPATTNARSCRTAGKRDHVVVRRPGRATPRTASSRSSSNAPQVPSSSARVELADDARRSCAPSCPGAGSGSSPRSNARLRLQRRVERLDDALRVRRSRPRRSPATCSRSFGQVAVREVDAGDLEERDRRCAPASTLRRAASTRLGSSRVRSAVSSTEIGSGSFHGVSSSGRRRRRVRSRRTRARRARPRPGGAAAARASASRTSRAATAA